MEVHYEGYYLENKDRSSSIQQRQLVPYKLTFTREIHSIKYNHAHMTNAYTTYLETKIQSQNQ